MTKTSRLTALWMSLLLLTACSSEGTDPSEPSELEFTFDEDSEGWSGSFSDIASQQVDDVQFLFERRPLPVEVGGEKGALFVSGKNVSDDLFLFLTFPVAGLQPDTSYELIFELELASDAPTGCTGIGGAPGESVFLKAGAAPFQPERVMDASGALRLNVDKGNQSGGGANAQVLGDIANGSADCLSSTYRRISRDNRSTPFRMNSDSRGRLWLLLGTDSGFEGTTSLYFDTVRVLLTPR